MQLVFLAKPNCLWIKTAPESGGPSALGPVPSARRRRMENNNKLLTISNLTVTGILPFLSAAPIGIFGNC